MLTLGIVNTYNKIKVLDAHYRAIARAAPICYAYNFSLSLYDFPFDIDLIELVRFVSEKTTIGNEGKYLHSLYSEQHLFSSDFPKNGFPSHFGKIIATTSKPDLKKSLDPASIVNGVLKNRSYLFLVGLGRKGLSKETLEMATYHLDITNNGISLETCTAIGAIPTMIHFLTMKSNKSNTIF